jgi:DNA-binding response OmpR family regulator
MRALLVDHDPPLLESLTRAVRDICVLDTVTTKDLCLEKLRAESFDAVIVCDRLADGHGLELLAQIAQQHPSTLRAFAAHPRRLMQMRGRLGPFNLFQAVRYPIAPIELRAMLKSAQAAQAANADTTNVQHIVLEGDAAVEPQQHFEIAPDWRPQDAALAQPAKPAPLDVEVPQWTVEGSSANEHPASLFERDTARKVTPIRGPDFSRNIGAARRLVRESQTVVQLRPAIRRVVIALTRDKECLDNTIAALAGRAVSVMHASDEDALAKALKKHGAIAVLIDIGVAGSSIRRFLERICALTSDTYVLVVGRATDSPHIAPLLSKGKVHRFLVKPMNRGQTRSAFDNVPSLPADGSSTNTREAVPFASIIDRVTATDLRSALDKQPWHTRLSRFALHNWHWVLAATVSGLFAMFALAFLLST